MTDNKKYRTGLTSQEDEVIAEHAMNHYPKTPDILPQFSRIQKVWGEPADTHLVGAQGRILGAMDCSALITSDTLIRRFVEEDPRNRYLYFINFDGDDEEEITACIGQKIAPLITKNP